jgi:thiol-disulfide isomerase/thioredoxin
MLPKPRRIRLWRVQFLHTQVFCLYLFLVLCICQCGCRESSGLRPGDFPPSFEAPTLGGRLSGLPDFKGQVVLLNFWASWCSSCLEELPSLMDLQRKLGGTKFTVVSVAVADTDEGLAQAKERFGITFPILLDPEGSIKGRYRVTGFPESFLLDKQGRLVMLVDSVDIQPRIRIAGPRDWGAEILASQIKSKINERRD